MKKIHFMGIGGSGISGAAIMAKRLGYEVTGCDIEKDTSYLRQVKEEGIKVYHGHDESHLEGKDLLVAVPAVFFEDEKHPELKKAQEEDMAMTWQEFVGKELQRGKKVICVSGTHGKSTTTAMAGLTFENAKKDPSCLVGALVKKWDESVRVGKGEVFITEADEFFDNFLNYSPDTIILNNIEYDHPDYFDSEEKLFQSFKKHIETLTGSKTLIVNQDSKGIKRLLSMFDESFLSSLNILAYTRGSSEFELKVSLQGEIAKKTKEKTLFKVSSDSLELEENFELSVPGEHNVSNALGVILLAKISDIRLDVVRETLSDFEGIGRRLELIGEKNGVLVYDDYAHHPTAIEKTLEALKQKHKDKRVWAVVEPHSYSRTKALLPDYSDVFEKAEKVIVGPIFKARDKKTFGVTGESVVKASNHKDASYVDSVGKIVSLLKESVNSEDIIIVMGAGESYKWSRKILKSL